MTLLFFPIKIVKTKKALQQGNAFCFENYFILLNKKGHLKKCLIFETTEQKLYYGVKHFKKENKKYAKFTDEELVKKIFSHIKFKIYKKIKIRLF